MPCTTVLYTTIYNRNRKSGKIKLKLDMQDKRKAYLSAGREPPAQNNTDDGLESCPIADASFEWEKCQMTGKNMKGQTILKIISVARLTVQGL